MPKIKFGFWWSAFYHKLIDVPKGFLLIKYDPFYRENLGKYLMKLDAFQDKKRDNIKEKYPGGVVPEEDFLRKLEGVFEYHYKKRTLDQNALMWALYEIEANEMNGGQKGHREQMIIPDDLYNGDLQEYGERETITTMRKNLSYYTSEYRIIEAVTLDDGKEISVQRCIKLNMSADDRITLRVIRGTSKLNTREMAEWIERLFNRIAYNGVQVTNSGEIESYWLKFQQHKNDNKIVLHDTIMTQQEYKAFKPICEACGKFISEGEGELAHIKAVGMGGDRTKEPKHNYTSNWLHLHAMPCHRQEWHEKGVKSFIKKYKHLTYKVNTALNRDYQPITETDTIKQEVFIPQVHEENATAADVKSLNELIKDENVSTENKVAAVMEKATADNIAQVKQLYAAGKINQDEACMQLDKLGGDPYEINPDWIGIF